MSLRLTPIPGARMWPACPDCGGAMVPEGQGRPWNVCVDCGQTGPPDPGKQAMHATPT